MEGASATKEPIVPEPSIRQSAPIRIGAVSYLNARPLSYCLGRLAPRAKIVVDVPSRLAEGLESGQLDVALVSSIQHFRTPGSTIVSDACVACRGPVRSLKLYGRVAPERVRTLALDEGSRTSAALTRILLKERFGLEPQIERLPIGASAQDTAADAVMLIGDRGMRPLEGRFAFVWDLGEEWVRWTGLPFVCAMWVARPLVDLDGLERALEAARDEGQRRLDEIARQAAPEVGISEEGCLAYLRDDLVFRLGQRERRGLLLFSQYAVRHGLASTGGKLVFYDPHCPGKGD
jgi:chorismate dehydratase